MKEHSSGFASYSSPTRCGTTACTVRFVQPPQLMVLNQVQRIFVTQETRPDRAILTPFQPMTFASSTLTYWLAVEAAEGVKSDFLIPWSCICVWPRAFSARGNAVKLERIHYAVLYGSKAASFKRERQPAGSGKVNSLYPLHKAFGHISM